jgi:tetratricopeptide (TPR) repeat protein
LEQATQQFARHPAAWGHLGLARMHDSQPDRALEALRHAAELEPGNDAWKLFAAVAHLDLRELAEARQTFDEVLGREPGNLLARQLRGLLLWHEGKEADAIKFYGESAEPPLANRLLLPRLMVEIEKRLLEEEGPLFRPPSPVGRCWCGMALDPPGPIVVPVEDDLPEYFTRPPRGVMEAVTQGRLMDEIKARRLMGEGQKMVERVLDESKARILAEESVSKSPELWKAIEKMEDALELDPFMARGFFFLGEASFLARLNFQAEKALLRSQKDDGDTFLNLYYLGRLAKQRGDRVEARRRLEAAVRAFDKFPEALYVLGQLAVVEGHEPQARDYLCRAVLLDMWLVRDRLEALRRHLEPVPIP